MYIGGFICASFVVFGSFVYYDDQWVLFQATNFLSWSFAAAIAGFILLVITGILFMVAGRRKQQQEQFSNAHVLPSNMIPTHSIGGTIVASELPMQPDRLYTMSLPPGSTKHEEMLVREYLRTEIKFNSQTYSDKYSNQKSGTT